MGKLSPQITQLLPWSRGVRHIVCTTYQRLSCPLSLLQSSIVGPVKSTRTPQSLPNTLLNVEWARVASRRVLEPHVLAPPASCAQGALPAREVSPVMPRAGQVGLQSQWVSLSLVGEGQLSVPGVMTGEERVLQVSRQEQPANTH